MFPNPVKVGETEFEIALKPYPGGPGPCLEDKYSSLNNSEIKLFDIHGRAIFSQISKSEKFAVSNLKGMKPGSYILNIISPDGEVINKVILVE